MFLEILCIRQKENLSHLPVWPQNPTNEAHYFPSNIITVLRNHEVPYVLIKTCTVFIGITAVLRCGELCGMWHVACALRRALLNGATNSGLRNSGRLTSSLFPNLWLRGGVPSTMITKMEQGTRKKFWAKRYMKFVFWRADCCLWEASRDSVCASRRQ